MADATRGVGPLPAEHAWFAPRQVRPFIKASGTELTDLGCMAVTRHSVFDDADRKGRMHISSDAAKALGFPKQRYMAVELERRWLCEQSPGNLVTSTEVITDLYVTGSRLRLRAARPLDGGPPMLKLSRKADVDARTRLITSIYLPEPEYQLLASSLSGVILQKRRHRLRPTDVATICVDEFEGELAGLFIAEAEFADGLALSGFATPAFAGREVTDDLRFTGASLARFGLPQ